jgi:cystathionine beta-lyase/cystathionine gamma-synthase
MNSFIPAAPRPPDRVIRLSVGLEDSADLRDGLDQTLDARAQ